MYFFLPGFLKRVWTGNIGHSTGWSFENLDDGQYISYVQAIDGGFAPSPFSDPSIFYIGIPADPENLTSSENEKGVRLEWDDKSNNEEFFIIERSMDGENLYEAFDSVIFNIVNFVDTKLPPTFNASYRLQAVNPNGGSNYTSSSSLFVDGRPTNPNVSQLSNGINLVWEDHSINEEYFIIERKSQEDSLFVKIDSVTSDIVEFFDTDDLENEITYRIYAKNEFGISDYSEEVKIVILSLEKNSVNSIKVYPNPFDKSIFISNEYSKLEILQINIFSLDGKSLPFKNQMHHSGILELIVEDENPRTCLINIRLSNEIISLKMLKE
jgi:hypothetical protein